MFTDRLDNASNKIQFCTEVEHLEGTGKHAHDTLTGEPEDKLSAEAHCLSLLTGP